MEHWPQEFTNKQVRVLIDRVAELEQKITRLHEELASLEQRKQDRRGRKAKTAA